MHTAAARQWYQRIDAVHELTDGRLVATERDCHPDSIAEAFRRRITVLELQQIIGRGLWRTANNPLHVLVLTDVPLDMPVEELTTDAAERPGSVGAIAFECAAHAVKAFPEMWKDADRAVRAPTARPRPARRNHHMAIPDCRPRWAIVAGLRAAAHDRRRGAGLCRVDPRPARLFRENTTKRCIQFPVRSSFYWEFNIFH